jgi:hypothetical protein
VADPTLPPIYTPAKTAPSKNTKTPKTRMAKQLAPKLAPIPLVYTVAKVAKLAKKKAKPLTVAGKASIDDQFSATITFSPAYGTDAGRTYGASLGLTPGGASPEALKEFYVRCLIEQHRVDPLLQGFETTWEPPPGWTTMDGLGSIVYDEAISNPVQITRVYKSPASPSSEIGFRVRITKKYKP